MTTFFICVHLCSSVRQLKLFAVFFCLFGIPYDKYHRCGRWAGWHYTELLLATTRGRTPRIGARPGLLRVAQLLGQLSDEHSQLDEHIARHAKTICTAKSVVRHCHTRRSTRLFPSISPDGQSPIERRRHRHTSRRRRWDLACAYRHRNLSNNQRRHLHRACSPSLCTRRSQKTAAINHPTTLIGLSKPRSDHNRKCPHRRQRQQWDSNLPGPGTIESI